MHTSCELAGQLICATAQQSQKTQNTTYIFEKQNTAIDARGAASDTHFHWHGSDGHRECEDSDKCQQSSHRHRNQSYGCQTFSLSSLKWSKISLSKKPISVKEVFFVYMYIFIDIIYVYVSIYVYVCANFEQRWSGLSLLRVGLQG